MVDELSNLKKNRVRRNKRNLHDTTVFSLLIFYIGFFFKTESLYPAEEQQHILPGRQSRNT